MAIEVCTLGGFSDTGRNSTAIKIDDEVVILDMGLHMENYIQHTEDREDISAKTYEELLKVKALPDYHAIKEWKEKVVAIIPSHGHLDHVGAVPFAAPLFPKAPIICTPYTAEVLKTIFLDEKIKVPNQLISLNLNSSYKISKNITVELLEITHSIPHTAMVILHTPYGLLVYANDYKFDRHPILGKKPNFERLEELGKEGVRLLIVESLYADLHRKTPSESVAQQMLNDVMLGINSEHKAMIVTTFSSHIARLKSIVEFGKKMNRKVIFLGRSLSKYVTAAENIQLVHFSQDIKVVKYQDKVAQELKHISKDKGKYLLVTTGHQGEPKAVLSKLARGELPFHFEKGDIVVFSCSIIPVELNQNNRERLERQLTSQGVRIFRDIHVSGHASREDHRDLLELLKPKYVIPAHAGYEKAKHIASLAIEMDIPAKNVFLMENGKKISIPD